MCAVVVAAIVALPGCTGVSAALPPDRWQCLGDRPLADLIARAQTPLPHKESAQNDLSAAIARRYIALRGAQTALVLLAEREALDTQTVAIARQRPGDGILRGQTAAAHLAQTRADQQRGRAAIAMLRIELAILTGAAPATLDSLPGGSIPLPPKAVVSGATAEQDPALADFRAASRVAARAQLAAEQARAVAARQDKPPGTGGLPLGAALAADRQALDALQAEEQAREIMTQAYVLWLRSLEPTPLSRSVKRLQPECH